LLVLLFLVLNAEPPNLLFCFFLFLPSLLFWDLTKNASSTVFSCLISLLCSCACSAFNNSTKVMLDKSLEFSKDEIVVSNFFGIVTRIFWTILESEKSVLRSFILLIILR
jgi:hypothetical protein